MKRKTILNRLTFTIIAASALLLTLQMAHAQLGSGWTPLTLSGDFIDYEVSDVHHQHSVSSFSAGGMFYVNDGAGTETFGLTNGTSNRVEHDTNHHYQTGSIEFEGVLQINPGISGQFCLQIFDGTASGPILALVGYGKNNGTLEKQGGDVIVATDCFTPGQTELVNVIHDLNANTLTLYINGVQKWSGGGGAGDSFNFKYGLYGSFNAPTATVWKNAKFWTGGSATAFSGWYQIIDHNSGKNANVNSGATTNGAAVILYTTGTASNEEWQMTPTDSGYYKIVNRKSGKVMAVQSASTAAGAKVIQWDFGSAQNDQWLPVYLGGGYYKLVNRHSGLVLDVTGGNTSNGTPFEQWTDDGGKNQQFQFASTP